jgi:hypothetical protein
MSRWEGGVGGVNPTLRQERRGSAGPLQRAKVASWGHIDPAQAKLGRGTQRKLNFYCTDRVTVVVGDGVTPVAAPVTVTV